MAGYFISDVDGNNIGDMEISTISQHRWTYLKELHLGTCLMKQGTTISVLLATGTLARQVLVGYNFFILVLLL